MKTLHEEVQLLTEEVEKIKDRNKRTASLDMVKNWWIKRKKIR